ncbi:MAG: hypothetical protein LC679_18205 [Intrasporangiaceae bacterium]|nr:hypothetical protein [Intrasporangiaceae bacterium]
MGDGLGSRPAQGQVLLGEDAPTPALRDELVEGGGAGRLARDEELGEGAPRDLCGAGEAAVRRPGPAEAEHGEPVDDLSARGAGSLGEEHDEGGEEGGGEDPEDAERPEHHGLGAEGDAAQGTARGGRQRPGQCGGLGARGLLGLGALGGLRLRLDLDDGLGGDHDPAPGAVQAPAEVDVCGDLHRGGAQVRCPAADLAQVLDAQQRTDARGGEHVGAVVVLALVALALARLGDPAPGAGEHVADREQGGRAVRRAQLGSDDGGGARGPCRGAERGQRPMGGSAVLGEEPRILGAPRWGGALELVEGGHGDALRGQLARDPDDPHRVQARAQVVTGDGGADVVDVLARHHDEAAGQDRADRELVEERADLTGVGRRDDGGHVVGEGSVDDAVGVRALLCVALLCVALLCVRRRLAAGLRGRGSSAERGRCVHTDRARRRTRVTAG